MNVPGASREEKKAAGRVENKAGRSVGHARGGESEQAERGSTQRLPHDRGMSMGGDEGRKRCLSFISRGINAKKEKKKGITMSVFSNIPLTVFSGL